MQSQKQKTIKSKDDAKPFNDAVKSLLTVLETLYTNNSSLVIFLIFFLLICFYLVVRAINVDYIYSFVVTLLFVFLSICLYVKEKNSLSSILSFSLGIFTAFTVPWNGSTFSIFFISFTILIIFIFFIASVRAAAKVEEKLTKAAISYINDIETNKKDLKAVVENVTKATKQSGLLSIHTMWEAILFFAYQKVPKSRMITLVTALNRIYTLTKVDTESLLILLNNINLLSQTEESLAANTTIVQLFLLKGKSTPSKLVNILNDTLHIAIENDVDFGLFTDTILTHLSHGYTQSRILEKLSAKFTKDPSRLSIYARNKRCSCKQIVECYNSSAMSSVVLKITQGTREQIDHLARITGKPQETVLREVVETGLKSYQTTPTKGVKALLDLTEWTEEHHITGPADLSTNHNKYAWEE